MTVIQYSETYHKQSIVSPILEQKLQRNFPSHGIIQKGARMLM